MRIRSYMEWLARVDAEAAKVPFLERSVYGAVEGPSGTCPLVRYRTRDTGPERPVLLVTAGFHGEEPAGPLSFARPEFLWTLAMLSAPYGAALDIFPCVNPTGFEAGTRYNARGERPNNDLLRYEMPDGRIVGELTSPETPFERWMPFRDGPEETRALLTALEASPAPAAAIDIHQDASVAASGTYAYVLGPREGVRVAQEVCGGILPILRDTPVHGARSDAEGFIASHDGSVTDYAFRRGAKIAVCLETTTDADAMRRSWFVHDVWLSAMIAIAGGSEASRENLAYPSTWADRLAPRTG